MVRAHLGTLRAGRGDFTIELPGRGEEDACCAAVTEVAAPPVAPAPGAGDERVALRERAHAVSREAQRVIVELRR